MVAVTRLLATLVAVAGLLVFPGPASAEIPGSDVMSFRLQASNGYTLQVKTERTQTQVTAWKADRRIESTYFVEGSAAGSAIDADLGPLGRIDVEFEPSGRGILVSPPGRSRGTAGCRIRRRLGTFTGEVVFRGEDGYTTAEATSVPGSIGPSVRGHCGGASASSSATAPASARRRVERVWGVGDAILMSRNYSTAGVGQGGTLLLVSAEHDSAYFSAYRIEIPGPQIAIARRAEVRDSRSSFSYGRTMRSALIRPPAPFAGEATYSERRGHLVGNLTVQFPGLPPQLLTGGDFEASLRPLR
jgi:hypothetical protein